MCSLPWCRSAWPAPAGEDVTCTLLRWRQPAVGLPVPNLSHSVNVLIMDSINMLIIDSVHDVATCYPHTTAAVRSNSTATTTAAPITPSHPVPPDCESYHAPEQPG